jgi:hypothetical protein
LTGIGCRRPRPLSPRFGGSSLVPIALGAVGAVGAVLVAAGAIGSRAIGVSSVVGLGDRHFNFGDRFSNFFGFRFSDPFVTACLCLPVAANEIGGSFRHLADIQAIPGL